MEYISVKEAAKKWRISVRRVQTYCAQNKIQGIKNIGKQYIIPRDAQRPIDMRTKNAKAALDISTYHFPIMIFSPVFSAHAECSDKEMILLKSQLLYLEGNFEGSIRFCNYLINNTNDDYLLMGAYTTIAFNSIFLGNSKLFNESFNQMKYFHDLDNIHKEDNKLIIASLKYQITNDHKQIDNVDPNLLSPEALLFYEYLIYMIGFFESSNNENIQIVKSLNRKIELEGIDPLSISLCCRIAGYAHKNNNINDLNFYMEKACSLSLKNGWLSYFSRFYKILEEPMTKTLNQINKVSSAAIKRLYESNKKNCEIIKKETSI